MEEVAGGMISRRMKCLVVAVGRSCPQSRTAILSTNHLNFPICLFLIWSIQIVLRYAVLRTTHLAQLKNLNYHLHEPYRQWLLARTSTRHRRWLFINSPTTVEESWLLASFVSNPKPLQRTKISYESERSYPSMNSNKQSPPYKFTRNSISRHA